MKEELLERISELEKKYNESNSERNTLLDQADLMIQKMNFIKGAIEENKLIIKKHYPECEQPETSKQN